jgi:hypothetical protein
LKNIPFIFRLPKNLIKLKKFENLKKKTISFIPFKINKMETNSFKQSTVLYLKVILVK